MKKGVIRAEFLLAFLRCERKAFLLINETKPSSTNCFFAMVDEVNKEQRNALSDYFQREILNGNSGLKGAADDGVHVLFDLELEVRGISGNADALLSKKSKGKNLHEAVISSPYYSIQPIERLRLGWVTRVLSESKNYNSTKAGFIYTRDAVLHRVHLRKSLDDIDSLLTKFRSWRKKSGDEPPPACLVKHCAECQFQKDCADLMRRDDSLSLLSGLSLKKVQQYHKKGIFTVTQLSYQFRPRRSKKRSEQKAIYKPELQALALRSGKTYLASTSKITRSKTEIYLDIEGIPEAKFTYLIGLQVVNEGRTTSHSFWASNREDEQEIWCNFFRILNQNPECPVFHYGQYEYRACKNFVDRYSPNEAKLLERFVNVVSFIYGQVYFPTYGNGLKEIGKHLGVEWSGPIQSGIETLVWRQRWEWSKTKQLKDELIQYNQFDCDALRLLVDRLDRLSALVETDISVDHAYSQKRKGSRSVLRLHNDLEKVLILGHTRYNKRRIAFSDNQVNSKIESKTPAKKGRAGLSSFRITRVVDVAPRRKCPNCKNQNITVRRKKQSSIVVDLHFTSNGCRKSVTRYIGRCVYCPKCDRLFSPRRVKQHTGNRYGEGLLSYVVYQRLCLRLSNRLNAESMNSVFGLHFTGGTIERFTRNVCEKYGSSEQKILSRLVQSKCLHCDETKVNIEGTNRYVWVLTNGSHVWFKCTKTREAHWLEDLLKDFDGVFITDFYAGYDALECRQQKCLSHLIRDLNEDVWKEPFNSELEEFVEQFKILICGIMETIQTYGSRIRNLRKHQKDVQRFYRKCIRDVVYSQESTRRFQKRFMRYEESLFTFLSDSNIPWNNNLAERALRHLAIQRKISGSFGKDGIHRYLRLLGIAQTCRFQEKSFLKFLLSGSKDVDIFKS